MIPIPKIIHNYPNIANFFSHEWFESELKKDDKDIHLLAKQLTFDEDDDISFIYLEHVEKCLKELKDCMKNNENHFKGFTHKERYHGIIAELEIGLMCKCMGFNIELEPSIQGGKLSDIKIVNVNPEIFIEVSIRKGPPTNWKNIENRYSKLGISKFRTPSNFKQKILKEGSQLSKINPGIVALKIDPSSIPEIPSIIRGFGFSRIWEDGVYIEPGERIDNSMISALLIHCYYIAENEKNDTRLYINPVAKFPLPISVIEKFKAYGVRVIIPSIS
jgi:hypothetical protein